ncbi:hypothetical protein EUGRSUZ_K01388 [Eucalyptus grandis]|uniref:Uncharacterized protein n=2 Tax=Eucalyptus grandis TaxID=71139 RepID=A0ACC3IUX3_EUCGR|nr:hypothetical protein EUGRSUZ_K01388 [Eucalyptus grandis]
MPEETHLLEAGGIPKKRKSGHKKGRKTKKKVNVFPGAGEKIKIDNRMRKLFRKRAREYDSDDDEEDEEVAASKDDNTVPLADDEKNLETHGSDDDEPEVSDNDNEEEDDEVHPGIMKFTEGVRAFRTAFQSIIKKSVSDDSLGPVMSAHKNLVAEKLAEEETERKAKGEAKKEKHLVGEKGHVKPANYLDAHEKFLISVATKGGIHLIPDRTKLLALAFLYSSNDFYTLFAFAWIQWSSYLMRLTKHSMRKKAWMPQGLKMQKQ